MIDETLILDSADCLVDVETQGELTRGHSSICVPNTPEIARTDPLACVVLLLTHASSQTRVCL